MTYQVAYNPALGNALVGVATHFDTVPDGLLVETIEGDIPDLTKCVWSEGALRFDLVSNTLEAQLAHAKARIAMLEQDVSTERTERLLMQRRLKAAEQGVPVRYVRNADWEDVDFALKSGRGGQ